MVKKILAWALLGVFGAGGAWAEPTLTIRILEKKRISQIQVLEEGTNGTWTKVKLSRGFLMVNGKPGTRRRFGGKEGFRLKTRGLERYYPGFLTLSVAPEPPGENLMFLNEVSFNEYVTCVTAAEAEFDLAFPEYLKALAAVVRGYAHTHLHRHPGYDLCDLAHCQVYAGIPSRYETWLALAESSREGAHHRSGNIFYFHRCCGGTLESPEAVWNAKESRDRPPFPDQWKGKILCRGDSHFHWRRSVPLSKLVPIVNELGKLPPGGRLRELRVTRLSAGGTVLELSALVSLPGDSSRDLKINAEKFISLSGKSLGWGLFPSRRFKLSIDGSRLEIEGMGLGHGVGLCQSGARRLAQLGWSWREILKFYFPN
jgi:stage II sporulation protein D